MNYIGEDFPTQKFACNSRGCYLYSIRIRGDDERAARRAWNKSLIGRLRKEFKKIRIQLEKSNGVLYGYQIQPVFDILRKMLVDNND